MHSDLRPNEVALGDYLKLSQDALPPSYKGDMSNICNPQDYPILRLHLGALRKCPNLVPAFEANSSMFSVSIEFDDTCLLVEDGEPRGFTVEAALMLSHCMSISQTLIHLSLSSSNITDDVLISLSSGLLKCLQLVHLELSRNKIGDDGAAILARLFTTDYCLGTLDLSHNSIGHRGASALASSLCQNETLEELNLSTNTCGDDGGISLFQNLCLNDALMTLRISCNGLTRRSLPFLAALLTENRTIKRIDVSGNPLGDGLSDDKFAVLVKCVATNTQLVSLDARSCGFTPEQMDQLIPSSARTPPVSPLTRRTPAPIARINAARSTSPTTSKSRKASPVR